jgi:hypothetical protein
MCLKREYANKGWNLDTCFLAVILNYVVLSCFLAVILNFYAYSIIGEFSAITYQVSNQAKTILTLIVGSVLFRPDRPQRERPHALELLWHGGERGRLHGLLVHEVGVSA